MRSDTTSFKAANTAAAKEPRFVVAMSFDSSNTVIRYFTSHADAAVPTGAVTFSGFVEGLSGTSQQLNPDKAVATIGSWSFDLVDVNSEVTDLLGEQLQLGRGTREKRVQFYMGFADLAWADYSLLQTQIVEDIVFSNGRYRIRCADVQRQMRKEIFDLAKTTLSQTLSATATTINVYDTSDFEMVAHGTSYSDAPSRTVGYVEIDDEIIRYSAKTATTFTVDTNGRGAFNTLAVEHVVDASTSADRATAVEEFVYLEMPAVKLALALLKGTLYNQGGATLPSGWHLGIASAYVREANFTGVGTDLWDTSDDTKGFIVRFAGLTKQDGKRFIEEQLMLLLGTFTPIYADGALGLKRMANVLAGAAYVQMFDETNVVSVGDLTHDFKSLHNVITIDWNWEFLFDKYTRRTALIDVDSVEKHQAGPPYNVEFLGLHGSRHADEILHQRFQMIRDRYTGPPLRMPARVMPSHNAIEVGDIVRMRLPMVRDFVARGTLDRSFEVQQVQVDWVTGSVNLTLFGSSQAPDPTSSTDDATVLTQAWYTGTGTELSTVLTITGSNPARVTASGTLTGGTDLTAAGSIFYFDGDLQIDPGVTITIHNNVQLRVRGFVTNNGTIDGTGNGLAGATAVATPTSATENNAGTAGFIGSTEPGGATEVILSLLQYAYNSYRGNVVVGSNATMPAFNLGWDGTTLSGIPTDLRGTSGSSGLPISPLGATFTGGRQGGGAGGDGGAGFCLVSRGFAQGVNGEVNLSGAAGSAGPSLTYSDSIAQTIYAGSGAGGSPGGFLLLLDGANATVTDIDEAHFLAFQGDTPITGTPATQPSSFRGDSSGNWYSYYVGTGDDTTFPKPNLSGARGGMRVQYIPGNVAATEDITEVVTTADSWGNWFSWANPKNFALLEIVWAGNAFVAVGAADGTDAYIVTSPNGQVWTERANPKNFALRGITTTGSLLVAVGDPDGSDAYIVTSADGITWTERANPKNFALTDIVWNGSLLVAVGNADGSDAYIVTSSNGTAWTERSNPKNFLLNGVAWNGSLFVAVGAADGTDAYIVTSPDGITWTERANPKNFELQGIAWNGSLFVAVGAADGTDAYIVTSPDGITWTERANPINVALLDVAWNGSVFCAVGLDSGAYAYLLTSPDGIAWTRRVNPQDLQLAGVAWNGAVFCAVGSAGTSGAYIITSLSS